MLLSELANFYGPNTYLKAQYSPPLKRRAVRDIAYTQHLGSNKTQSFLAYCHTYSFRVRLIFCRSVYIFRISLEFAYVVHRPLAIQTDGSKKR